MFKNIFPIFEKKRILKKELLENLRDYPRDIFEVFYQDYSNGILTGCSIRPDDISLHIQPGIIYFDKVPYLLTEEWRIPYEATGNISYLKVKFLDKTPGIGQDEYLSQIYLDEMPPDMGYELELARFKLQAGARLRWEYTDFFDIGTEFDTLNCIHVPYASLKKSSIAPYILRSFAKTLLKYPLHNSLDSAFCMSCLQTNETLLYDVIHTYLNARSGQDQNHYSNEEIFVFLGKILSEVGETDGKRNWSAQKDKKLILL